MADKGIHANYIAPILAGLVVTVAGAGVASYLGSGDRPEPHPASADEKDSGKLQSVWPRKAIHLRCPESVTIERNGSEMVRVAVERTGWDGDLGLSVTYPCKMFTARRWLLHEARALLPTTLKRGQSSALVKVHAGDKPGTYPVTLRAATKSGAETPLADEAPLRVVVK
jgi:hypothetical protein